MRFREVEELLFSFHQSQSSNSAGADGDQRLNHVETGSLRVRPGIHEGEHTLPTESDMKEEVIKERQAGQDAIAEILDLHAGHEEDGGGHRHTYQRRSQIGLLHNEQGEDEARQGCRQKCVLPVCDALGSGLKKIGEEKNECGFREFGWLEGKRSKTNPAVRIVRTIQE